MQTILASYLPFDEEKVKTEFTAQEQLQKWDGPDVNFINGAWSVYINQGIEPKRDMWGSIPNRPGFTVCQHIRWQELVPFWKSLGIDTVFTPHACYGDDEKLGIRVLGFPHYTEAINDKSIILPMKRNYDISFMGAAYTHPVRQKLLDLSWDIMIENHNNVEENTIACVIRDTGVWHYEKSEHEQKAERTHHTNLLRHTRLALCPRGTGPGTIRVFEAMQVGAIPVILSDKWKPPVHWENWKDFSFLLGHEQFDVNYILDLVRLYHEEYGYEMAARAAEIYHTHLSGINFTRTIKDYYARCAISDTK